MENRKLVRFLIPILLLGFFISVNKSWAYDVGTHAFLTKEVISFYNQHFTKKISNELGIYLIDGARLEDNTPRYLNHFYDPINDRGLADGVYRGLASKLWAQDPKAQTALLYKLVPQTEASLLTAAQLNKIKPVFHQDNFTWQKAIELYARGETEQALFALGHIIHLIEDAAMPDHTRNDAHPPYDHGGSPYENWTNRFSLENPDQDLTARLKNKKPVALINLNEYFNSMAEYSNKNFYSRDSIKNYELPEPDYFYNINGDNFGFKKDQEFGDYKLILLNEGFDWADDKSGELRIPVLYDYWNRLSTKVVQHAAGVIDLFFKEAEKAKAKYELEKARRPYLSTLADGFKSIFGGGGDESANLIATVPLESTKEKIVDKPVPKQPDSLEPETIQTEIIALSLQSAESITINSNNDSASVNSASIEPQFKVCSFNTSQAPNRQGVIISEVAWMGSATSPNDEWIELKNISGSPANISEWQLLDMSDQIKVVFDSGAVIPVGGFYLLERTDDNTVLGITADKIYTGALSNAGEGLRLFDKNCGLIDEVFAAPDWPAGDADYKKTMERTADFSWRTSLEVGGTPKAENSSGIVPVSGASGGVSQSQPQPQLPQQEPSATSTPPEATEGEVKVLISEIRAGTDAGGAEDEFVELYNAGDQPVNLAGWSLKKKSSTGSESNLVSAAAFSGVIQPKSFFLIAHRNYQGSKVKDLEYSANSNNLAYTNNSVVLYNVHSGAVDEVSWTEIPKSQSWERKAIVNSNCVIAQNENELFGNGCDNNIAGDFDLRAAPKPQNSQDPPEPRTSASIQNFRITYSPELAEGLFFQWDAAIGASEYTLLDANFATSTILATTTATSYNLPITEIGRDYTFAISAADSDGFIYSATTTVNALSFFSINLYDSAIGLGKNQYPLPNYFNASSTTNWHAVIFYKNQEPAMRETLGESQTGWGYRLNDSLLVKYDNCQGSETAAASLVLPDSKESCDAAPTTVRQLGLKWGALEDSPIFIDLVQPAAEDDYITAAFYSYDPAQPDNAQRLIAIDKTKYYFQGERPENQPPTEPTNFVAQYSYQDREIILSWATSTDPDGPDSQITYELNYLDDLWQRVTNPKIIRGAMAGDSFTFNLKAIDGKGGESEIIELEYTVPLPGYINNVLFSHDEGGNFASFDLNDTNIFNNQAYSRYIMIWFNEDPAEVTVANRSSGISSNWAGGGCPAAGFVGEGVPEENPGTGFDHYVMPEYVLVAPATIKPPIYDRSKAPYHYKVYFTNTCPNAGFVDGHDLSEELSSEDFITVGLWFYNTPNGFMSIEESVNYPEQYYFSE